MHLKLKWPLIAVLFLRSRVISVHFWYLTSFLILSFLKLHFVLLLASQHRLLRSFTHYHLCIIYINAYNTAVFNLSPHIFWSYIKSYISLTHWPFSHSSPLPKAFSQLVHWSLLLFCVYIIAQFFTGFNRQYVRNIQFVFVQNAELYCNLYICIDFSPKIWYYKYVVGLKKDCRADGSPFFVFWALIFQKSHYTLFSQRKDPSSPRSHNRWEYM